MHEQCRAQTEAAPVPTTTSGLLLVLYHQIAAESGDPNMKAPMPKISMPFMEEEPEVVAMPVAREDFVDRCVVCAGLKLRGLSDATW